MTATKGNTSRKAPGPVSARKLAARTASGVNAHNSRNGQRKRKTPGRSASYGGAGVSARRWLHSSVQHSGSGGCSKSELMQKGCGKREVERYTDQVSRWASHHRKTLGLLLPEKVLQSGDPPQRQADHKVEVHVQRDHVLLPPFTRDDGFVQAGPLSRFQHFRFGRFGQMSAPCGFS